MKWYFQNLLCGLKTAFFIPAPQRVVGSWHAFMAIAATIVLSQIVMEFLVDGTGGVIAYSCYAYLACLFGLTLIISYIISFCASRDWPVLDISVAFLNSYYFIFLPYALVNIVAAMLYHSAILSWILYLTATWAFCIMFRIVKITCAAKFRILILSGLLAAGAVYLLNSHVYFSRIYYVASHEADDDDDVATSAFEKLTGEEIFNRQAGLRQKSLATLKVSNPGQTDIYALTLGPYSYQDVFMRDVKYVDARLKEKLGITNIIPMINNKATLETMPIADVTNLRAYLEELSAHYMQPKEDLVLIYLTSHGSAKDGVAANLGYRNTLNDISPQLLKKALDDSGIQNRVIIVSACYSGVFVPVLKDEHTMVITAAAADRTSFGCSDKNEFTYFTEAFFKSALSQTTDLETAFRVAQYVVQKRETAEGIKDNSNPQIFVGSKIKEALRNYKGANLAQAPPPDAKTLARFYSAAAQAYSHVRPDIELAQDVEAGKEWLRLPASQWVAYACYALAWLLTVFAWVVYRYNPGIFTQGAWKTRDVAGRIFSPAVFKIYFFCLGIILILAWLAWCAFLIATWR